MQRLHQSSDISTIFDKIKPKYLDNIKIYLSENNLSDNRLGIIISKKYIPLAVHRNRLKRQIKEIFRKNLITKNTKYDIIVIIRTKFNLDQKTTLLQQIQDYINNLT